jgi:hypothetical protein
MAELVQSIRLALRREGVSAAVERMRVALEGAADPVLFGDALAAYDELLPILDEVEGGED